MARKQLLLAALAMLVVALATTWPVRSERLISWDAANFALALDHIDIGAHQPHPPGYLGYVFAGRVFRAWFHDANAALVAWNVLTRAAAGLLILILTFRATDNSIHSGVAAASILLSSPLLWFYASNAEIYPSEMTLALATILAAAIALEGRQTAIYWMVAALALTALFKVSAMILLGPAAFYVWCRAERQHQVKSALLFVLLLSLAVALFYVIQPNFLELLWGQFSAATAPSRLGGSSSNPGLTLNRNLRDTMTNLLAALGAVNGLAFLVWVLVERQVPWKIDRWLLVLWAGAWLLLLLFVHIGNPGYVLPLLPVLALILGSWYGRQRTSVWAALVVTQAVGNVALVTLLSPPSAIANEPRYRDKPFLDRLASDWRPLTFPTIAHIRESDDAINQLLSLASSCDRGPWVVAAGIEIVDWRRTTYYLPDAVAVRLQENNLPQGLTRNRRFISVGDEPLPVASPCGLMWLSSEETVHGRPAGGRYLHGFGWVFPPGSGHASATGLSWSPTPG